VATDAGGGGASLCQACGGSGQPCCGSGAADARTCSSGLTCTAGGGGIAAVETCQ
jgi:hypothetical protein